MVFAEMDDITKQSSIDTQDKIYKAGIEWGGVKKYNQSEPLPDRPTCCRRGEARVMWGLLTQMS